MSREAVPFCTSSELNMVGSLWNRMLLQPPLVAPADGLDNRWAPTGREPNVKGVHQTHGGPQPRPWVERGSECL